MVAELLRLAVLCDEQAPSSVRQQLSQLGDIGWAMGDAMLVASELVTNAVQHAGCLPEDALTVLVSLDGQHVRISVFDPGRSGGSAKRADPRQFGGLGLAVVDQLATKWGSHRHPDSYEVWAELALSP